MSIDVNTIGSPSADAFRFNTIGDTVTGTIVYAGTRQRENRFNGNDENILHIVLATDDGDRSIYPVIDTNVGGDGYPSRMARAIADAVRAAGETRLAEGGRLVVRYNEDIPTDKGNPAKGFVAQYKPPAPDVDDPADLADLI